MERATQSQTSTIDLMIAATTPRRLDPVFERAVDRDLDRDLVTVDLELDVVDDRSPAAFATFYRDEYAALVRIAYLILDSREQAEEIVQDAFVRVHGRWPKVENPGAYMRAAVVNGCNDSLRRLRRYRKREPDLVGPTATIDAPDELSDALGRLNTRERSVLVLRYYGGMQEAEIAAALGMKVGTVKSTLHRGIEQLRKEIQP